MDLNIGISTNTDEPAWTRKSLAKFAILLTDGDGVEGERIELENIFNEIVKAGDSVIYCPDGITKEL
eukprot:scaffold1521_cov271-Chaetoceros_neogracile.AAC.15